MTAYTVGTSTQETGINTNVLRVSDTGVDCLQTLFSTHGLNIEFVEAATEIPGSHWGDDEAGLIANTLYARLDTPIHSVLHEGCHWLLMSEQRRQALHTDAGGTMMEENAVCYLQILLADAIAGVGRERMMSDMDTWGYSFRLGSAKAWFENDAEDALAFLRKQVIVKSGSLATDVTLDKDVRQVCEKF